MVNTRRLEVLCADAVTAPHAAGALVLDEHGDRKWGTHTAHVGRQYLANIGKVDNGVVSVTSLWADEHRYYPLHVKPYSQEHHFPKGKADPDFRTKLQLALELVEAAVAAGQTQSLIGTQMSQLAAPLLVLALTHSARETGLVTALGYLPPAALSLPAGALVDRWDRRRMMVFCDAVRALNMVGIPVALWLGHLSLLQLCVAALIEGTAFVFFNLAHIAFLPRLVGKEQVPTAVAQGETTWGIATLLGPSLGGLVYQTLGRGAPFLADALSYAVSVLALRSIRIPSRCTEASVASAAATSGQERDTRQMVRALARETMDGLTWTWRHRLVRHIILLSAGTYFVVTGATLTLVVMAREQHAPPSAIGVMLAMAGIGSIVGSFIAGPIQQRLTLRRIMHAMLCIQALLWPLLAIAPNAVSLGLTAACLDGAFTIYLVAQASLRLQLVPDELQGRVNGVCRLLVYGAMPLGSVVTGTLLESTGARCTVLVSFACLLVLAIVALPIARSRFADPSPSPAQCTPSPEVT